MPAFASPHEADAADRLASDPVTTPERIDVPPDPRDLPGAFCHRTTIEVRFRDTDAMGHVNNAVYHTYVEQGRVRYLDEVLERPLRLGVHGETSFILAESRMVHRSPAFFGETLTLETRVTRIGRTSVEMEHRLTAPGSSFGPRRLVAVCHSVLVAYDYAAAAPTPVPEDAVAKVEAFEGRRLRDAPSIDRPGGAP